MELYFYIEINNKNLSLLKFNINYVEINNKMFSFLKNSMNDEKNYRVRLDLSGTYRNLRKENLIRLSVPN